MIKQNDTDTEITLELNYDLSSTKYVLNSHQMQRGKHIYCNQRQYVNKTQF